MRARTAVLAALLIPVGLGAQQSANWSIEEGRAPGTLPLEYVAEEGTWMSLDVSPDGARIVFDLLGHIYEMPIAGGQARALTSGRSWNAFPRYSPDGTRIAFTSDREGTDDVWVLGAFGVGHPDFNASNGFADAGWPSVPAFARLAGVNPNSVSISRSCVKSAAVGDIPPLHNFTTRPCALHKCPSIVRSPTLNTRAG